MTSLLPLRRRLVHCVVDSLEAITGKQFVAAVFAEDDQSLTVYTFELDSELRAALSDVMAESLWNASKSL